MTSYTVAVGETAWASAEIATKERTPAIVMAARMAWICCNDLSFGCLGRKLPFSQKNVV